MDRNDEPLNMQYFQALRVSLGEHSKMIHCMYWVDFPALMACLGVARELHETTWKLLEKIEPFVYT